MVSRRQLVDYVRLGRPLFLAGGFLFHALGIAIARFQGIDLNPSALIWGQIAISAIQWMTHYCNDYFDLAADRANTSSTRWSGGSRILAEGRIASHVALKTAVALATVALATIFILGFSIQTARGTIPLLLLSVLVAWEYSGPPLRLHSRGLGAVTVVLLVPVLTPLVGYYLQAGRLTMLPFLASCPLAFLQASMIFVIDLPDASGDRVVGKRTLVVRLGRARSRRVFLVLLALTYLLLPMLVALGLPAAVAIAVLLPFPLGIWLAWHMVRGDGQDPALWNRLGFAAIAMLVGTVVLETTVFYGLAL